MKKAIIIVSIMIGTLFLCSKVSAKEILTALEVKDPSGNTVTVMLDACWDPVYKRWEPCYVVQPTCLNIVNKK